MKKRILMISTLAVVLMTSLASAATAFKTYTVRIEGTTIVDVYEDGKAIKLGRAGRGYTLFALVGSNPTNPLRTIAGCWEAGFVAPDEPPSIKWQALLTLRSDGTAEFLEIESKQTRTDENRNTVFNPKYNHRVTLMLSGKWERTAEGAFKLRLHED